MSVNKKTEFSEELFVNPPMSNRGVPFWSWNSTLDDKEKLLRQIKYFKEMGFGGFMMHSRTGLKSEYLGKDFMDAVKFCTEEAKKLGMYAWLYDEDRWPSGYAGGLVLKEDISLCLRYISFTQEEQEAVDSEKEGLEKGLTYFVAAYDVELDDDGCLKDYKRIGRYDEAKAQKWYAFSKRTALSGWFNGDTYVDPLNPDAIKKFLEITHDRYYKTVGEDFGESVPAIFFDEPAMAPTCPMNNAKGNENASLSWSYTIPEYFSKTYGYDILDKLPEAFWLLPEGELSQARHDIWDCISERYAVTYNDQIADWCEKHNIESTGHYLREEELEAQLIFNGDLMRQYRSMHIPGIDYLGCGRKTCPVHYVQARSVARQYGRKDIACEMYGVSNWEFDFSTFKAIGDWQAVYGVTTRIPHLAYLSMEGECKRDFPASIHYQSPWYKKFSVLEDYYARLRVALTSGKPTTDIAIIHPIESGWMLYGPNDQTQKQRDDLVNRFMDLNYWLSEAFFDFDYLCESLIPELCDKQSNDGLKVGEMTYHTVIVPDKTVLLRKTTVEALKTLQNNGGHIIFMGECPKCLDQDGASLLAEIYANADVVSLEKAALVNALENERLVKFLNKEGNVEEKYVYQLRNDADRKWLFITDGLLEINPPKEGRDIQIVIEGTYTPKVYNAFDGSIGDIDYEIKDGKTVVYKKFYASESLLLSLTDGCNGDRNFAEKTEEKVIWSKKIDGEVEYSLSEPNVLLLDFAEYAVDGGEFKPKKDLLKITLETKSELGLSDRGIQPWALPDKPIEHSLSLRLTVNSKIDCDNAWLGIERPDITEIIWNGVKVDGSTDDGWYIDEAIRKVRINGIKKGENELLLTLPLGVKTWAENCYLLGDFGVELINAETTVTERQDRLNNDYGIKVVAPAVTVTDRNEKLSFDSVVTQSLPFYSANVTYKLPINTSEDGTLRIKTEKYLGALVSVSLDGEEKGTVICQPYTLDIDNVTAGEHTVEITVWGNRYNTLACLHIWRDTIWNSEPGWFRRGGDDWTDSYRFNQFGLVDSPEITLIKKL